MFYLQLFICGFVSMVLRSSLCQIRKEVFFSDEGGIWAERWKIALRPKAKGAHAHVIERRNEMLRQQYHRTRGQAREEGLKVTKEEILDESVLALNCIVSVHGSTPHSALFGRAPNDIKELTDFGAGNDDESGGALSRHVHRVRELSLMNIIRGNAQQRLELAANSRTRPAAQLEDLKSADKVDI